MISLNLLKDTEGKKIDMKKIGEIATIKINMVLQGSINSIGFDVEFDPQFLEFQNFHKNGIFDLEIVKINDNAPNVITVALAETDEYIQDVQVDLFQAQFRCIKSGTTNVIFKSANREIMKDGQPADIESVWNDNSLVIGGEKIILSIVIE